MYRVPELENDLLLKISLRSVDDEDTTPISQVISAFQTSVVLLRRIYHMQLKLTVAYDLILCRNMEAVGIGMPVHS